MDQSTSWERRSFPDERRNQVEERRIVTALFSDVVGSTSLAEAMDPEDWGEIMAAIQDLTAQIIQQHNGQVIQFQGDGLLALFGAKTPTERDPENAIRAALAIQSTRFDVPIPDLALRVGIHTGLVVLRQIGSHAKREYAALGDAMNLAARLQAAAPPGGVIISHDTYRHVRGVFDLTPQVPISLKGKREPVQTYIVHRAKPRPFRSVTRGVAGIEVQTVGREREAEQLREAAAAAWRERRVIWAQLVGEPGIGKSRLLQDTWEHLELKHVPYRLFRARAVQGDAGQAFGLVRRMLFEAFQIAEDATLAQAQEQWMDQFMRWRGPDCEEEAQSLGLLLGLPFPDSPHLRALRDDPAQLLGRALVVGRTLWSASCAQGPSVVLLEDLHWADPSSIDYLLQMILESTPGTQGVFVLATARPEWAVPTALAEFPEYVQIDLEALAQPDCHTLVTTLLEKVEGVPDSVTAEIVNRSEGVPYFCEEMINWFLDRGIIDSNPEPWRFDAAQLQQTPLPETLQHLLLTRLAALGHAERAALERASVFGKAFWEGGLAALGVPDSRELLERAAARNLVHRHPTSTLAGEVEWNFQHTLLRDVTYESVLKRDRREWHRVAGQWLQAQAQAAGRLDEFGQVLGWHAEQAGAPGDLAAREQAAGWYLRAAEHAQARAALLEARRLFERVLELVPEGNLEHRWRALLGHCDVVTNLGDSQTQQVQVTALLDLARELGDAQQAIALSRNALMLAGRADYASAVPLYDAAFDAAQRSGEYALGALVLGWKVVSQARSGDFAGARLTAEQARARLAGADDTAVGKVLSNLALYYIESGDLVQAAEMHAEQATIAQRLGNRTLQANALGNLGYIDVLLGMPETGLKHLEQAVQICQDVGMRRELVYGRLNMGLAHWRAGNAERARTVLEQAQNDLVALGDRFAIGAGLCYLGLALELGGDLEAAEACLAQACEVYASIGVKSAEADALAGMARTALARGDTGRAREFAARVWEHLQREGTNGMEFPVRAYHICADVFTACRDEELAHAAVLAGHRELAERAGRISHPEWRRSYAEQLAEHRAIVQLYHALAAKENKQDGRQDHQPQDPAPPGNTGGIYHGA